MRPILLLGLLVTVVLAGCLGGGGTMTAKGGLGEALDAAETWSDDPLLVGVTSVEPFQRMFEEGEGEILVHLDSDQGDGSAPAWMYFYRGADRLVFAVVAAELGVLAEGWMSEDEFWFDEGAATIEGWNIDSDAAADILADHEDWPEMVEDMLVFWGLGMMDGDPYWFVEAENMTSSWSARVHAGNGTVMELEESTWAEYRAMDGGAWVSESAWAGGEVTPLSDPVTLSLDLPAQGDLYYEGFASATLGDVRFTLDGPDGVLVDSGGAGGDYLTGLPAGTYTLTATPDTELTVASVELFMEGYWAE